MLQLEPTPVPLHADDGGVVRVGSTRVTLSSVVVAYQGGATAEEIQVQYPSLELKHIYAALGFYLHNKPDVDDYLDADRLRADHLRRKIEARFPPQGIRERLLSRHIDRSDVAPGR